MKIELSPEELKTLTVKPVDSNSCKIVFYCSVEHSIKILADVVDCNDVPYRVASKQ